MAFARELIGDVNTERLLRLRARIRDHGLRNVRSSPTQLSELVTYREYGVDNQHVFYGYYDKNPQNEDSSRLLATVTNGDGAGTPNQALAKVGYFNLDCKFVPVAETAAWCWQQGCMLRWLSNGNVIIFNCELGGGYGARIIDVRNRNTLAELNRPIYSLSPTGKVGLSCSFSRLHRYRPGYGYPQLQFPNDDLHAPEEDGIWNVDIESGKSTLAYSLKHIAGVLPHESMRNAAHYINHLSFSPDGTNYLFVHLWVSPGGRQHSRMFTSSLTGCLKLLHNHYVSHYCWRAPKEIVVYSDNGENQKAYNLFEIDKGIKGQLFPWTTLPDGHCSFADCGDILLTDTYPDQYGYQHLYLIPRRGPVYSVGQFYHPAKLAHEARCDLHPRWGSKNDVIIDLAPDGRRKMAIIGVTELLARIRES